MRGRGRSRFRFQYRIWRTPCDGSPSRKSPRSATRKEDPPRPRRSKQSRSNCAARPHQGRRWRGHRARCFGKRLGKRAPNPADADVRPMGEMLPSARHIVRHFDRAQKLVALMRARGVNAISPRSARKKAWRSSIDCSTWCAVRGRLGVAQEVGTSRSVASASISCPARCVRSAAVLSAEVVPRLPPNDNG
jgi:hypothetical protein